MPGGNSVSLPSDFLDDLVRLHAPHLLAPPSGAPPPAVPGLAPSAPAAAPDTLPVGGPPTVSPNVWHKNDPGNTVYRPFKNGQEEFQAGKPTVTADTGSLGYYKQRIDQADYATAHPWGSPISEHPGFLGKVAHGLAKAGNIAGDIFAPEVLQNIPGTDLNRQLQRGADQRNLATATDEETKRENANTQKEAVNQKPDLAEAAGEMKGRLESQKETAQADRQAKSDQNRDDRLGKTLNSLEDRSQAGRQATDQRSKEHDQLERDLTNTREAGENQRAANREAGENARAKDKAGKPTADEQRRADLAENLNENLNNLEDIAKRRPDLFGPMAGRLTQLRGAIGTGDKDIATLETIKHQIGMAQISAHGMRSAHGIESAADSILNNLHNEPGAVMANIQAVRNSIKTFQDDVDRAKGGEAKPAAGGDKANPKDPLGIL